MNRNSDGSTAQSWINESKQTVRLSLTEAAWKILEEQARSAALSPSDLIERHLRRMRSPLLDLENASYEGPDSSREPSQEPSTERVYQLTESQLEALIAARMRAPQASPSSSLSSVAPAVEDAAMACQTDLKAVTAVSKPIEDDWFRQVIDAIPQKVWTCSPAGKIEYYNQQALQILGLTQEQLLSQSWRALIHREDLPTAIAAWRESLTTGNPFEMELRIKGASGQYRWNLIRVHLQRDCSGQALRWIGSAINIDNQKRLEQQLQQQAEAQTNHRQWLEAVLNLLPSPLMLVDLTLQQIVFSNRAANEIAAVDIANEIGDRYDASYFCTDLTGQFIPPDQLPSARAVRGERIHGEEINWHTPAGVFPLLVYADILPAMHDRATTGVVVLQDITERKRAEGALRESEERFRQLANAVPQIVWVVNGQGKLEYANEHGCEYSGLTLEQGLTREQTIQVIHPDDVEEAYQKWDVALSEVKLYQHECRLKRAADGIYRWFLVRALPIRDEQGSLVRWYGTSTDIHDRKQVEQEREQLLERERLARAEAELAQRQLSTLFETAPIGMALLDASQHYRSINEALAEINGLAREDHLGRTPADLFGQSDPNIVALCDDIYATGKPFITPNLPTHVPGRKDRRPGYYSVYYLPTTNAAGQVESLLAYVIDVTERFRLEQAQRFLADASQVLSSSLNYQTTLSSIAQLAVPHLADWCTVHIVDEIGTTQRLAVAHVNPEKVAWADELEQRYPYDPSEPRGVPQVIRTGQSELYTEIPDHLLIEAARDAEHLHILREVGFSSVMIVPLQGQGQAIGAISFIGAESGRYYDQHDLELAEELGRRAALAVENARLYGQAQRDRDRAEAANRVKDEFLAVLSHELRSPLNPILGWVGLLRQGRLDPTKTTYALETIERNAKLQVKLIEDLLDVSRILRGKLSLNMGPVNLPVIIEAALETVHLAAEAKAIQIQTRLEPTDSVLGDAARLQQVVWNLLSNAVKFTPAGGRVAVSLLPGQGYVEMAIQDTGQGIHPDFLPHVFEYFRQADSTTTRTFGGLGLGLAIVRHLVELHGGSVQADSPGKDQGATFTVRLPALSHESVQARVEEPGSSLAPGFPHLAGLRILLVDDDPDTRDVITFTLEAASATVTPVSSVQEALEVFQRSAFDLLLSDIGMPDRDGYSLIRQIRALPPEQGGQIVAIALTAYAGELNQKQALAAGFQLHISKPVEPEHLIEKLVRLMRPQ